MSLMLIILVGQNITSMLMDQLISNVFLVMYLFTFPCAISL